MAIRERRAAIRDGARLLCLVLLAAGSPVAADSSVPAPRPDSDGVRLCDAVGPGLETARRALAITPPDVVLRLDRHILPIGGSLRIESLEVTAHGACRGDVRCTMVDEPLMRSLLDRFVAAIDPPLRHGPPGSPHAGARFVTARFGGRSCAIADGAPGPLVPDDERRFAAVWDGVLATDQAGPRGVLPKNQDPGWTHRFDFDGDGRPDEVEVDYTGGGHCCYKLGFTLTTTGRTTRFPFEMDGGYVAGLDFSRPEHFRVFLDEERRPVVRMEIQTYGFHRDPIPRAWRTRYGIRRNRIEITYRDGRWIVRDAPSR